jgi:hypothetical protein
VDFDLVRGIPPEVDTAGELLVRAKGPGGPSTWYEASGDGLSGATACGRRSAVSRDHSGLSFT